MPNVHDNTLKIPICEKAPLFVAGQANRYCVKPAGHEGACVYPPSCAACGRTFETDPTANTTPGVVPGTVAR